MVFALGFVLFAVGILISVALHECGHMWAAQATGMKVRRYFVGFGPTLWSTKRGETEYGLKAIPLGGFCDISGMTALDEVPPEDLDRAMYRQATWKRVFVMSGGIAMNFVLGFVLIVVLAVGWGLPQLDAPPAADRAPVVGALQCVSDELPDGTLAPCEGAGPAQTGGLQLGDEVTAVNGVAVSTWGEFTAETRKHEGPITYTVRRAGESLQVTVTPQKVLRYAEDGTSADVSSVGVILEQPRMEPYGFLPAIPAAASFTGDLFVRTFQALAQMPAKVAALWDAVTGGERDPETPVSIYGASRIGGESAEAGVWEMFVLMLASLNFFLGAFNILPLLPLDGGHITVVLYEKIRNTIRGWRGLAPGGPVDYLRLLPVTYVAVVLGGAYMVLTLTADIVNPIRLFP
ncbi:site-2 protease family protein [Nocardia puris]|uniref:Zinc metalloprotease Rip1 n=1 Tax=Nocardia puris TaxID=208602 RepID=A0A366E2W0_9NOCA|nr:M50 family metallopeptidase [Nocardia puris]MBF6215469.1 site-2 protease family protein [Nocardia puris]MBF6369091.1 site-2 protease family protein [Nocardia puris]MBF6463292.1 site-2 protease family protein [Nocardia puris]RBO96673.1 RIP metalloprotease RseP [Nocardia puris]